MATSLVSNSAAVTNPAPAFYGSFFPKTSQFSLGTRVRPSLKCLSRTKVSCNGDQDNRPSLVQQIDRRDVLVGLGGLYGLTGGLSPESQHASAAQTQILRPDLSKCRKGKDTDLPDKAEFSNCCPPMFSGDVIDFKLPDPTLPLRTRPAAHLADKAYIAKYNKALALMKALPDSDPRSFLQQAYIHCAYCNKGYSQEGFPDLDLTVHGSWLFLPFHRWYLYFYEKILGSLINDPTFAIPFWNWDEPSGMQIPDMFTDGQTPLGDANRDKKHYPPRIVNLDFGQENDGVSEEQRIQNNLIMMHQQVVMGSKTAQLFHGGPFHAGCGIPKDGAGALENKPHNPVHAWCGDPNKDNHEDMGHLYSAGRDPLFYAHHANVDRLWRVWKQIQGGDRRDFNDQNWLETEFFFFDENKNLVRVNVKDSLDEKKLGYKWQQVKTPWVGRKPVPRNRPNFTTGGVANAATSPKKYSNLSTTFPLKLDQLIRTEVGRPEKSRAKKKNQEKEEVLVIDGIQLDMNKFVKFDVYINDHEQPVQLGDSEYAGSFVNMRHHHKHDGDSNPKTGLKLGITDLLEQLGADDDETIVVTLKPIIGCEDVSIDGIRVQLMG